MEPVIDEEFESKKFKVQGHTLHFFSSKHYEKTVREATVLLMFSQQDDVFQAMKSIQSMPKENTELEIWSTNSHCQSAARKLAFSVMVSRYREKHNLP